MNSTYFVESGEKNTSLQSIASMEDIHRYNWKTINF